MKNTTLYLSIALMVGLFQHTYAQENSTKSKKLLQEVNKEWQFQKDGVVGELNDEMSDYQLIQQHLILVEQTLRKREVGNLSDVLLENRKNNLDHLSEYWKEAAFPINTSLEYRNPIFIDEFNNYCAVGYLIKRSGQDELARKIARETNYAYVKEMKDPELIAWAETSGLTLDELAWIQPGYPPQLALKKMNRGTNGVVNDIVEGIGGSIVVAGEFSQVDGQSINNIALWTSGFAGFLWSDIGGGVQGKVNALLFHENVLYAAGAITKAGGKTVSGVASFEEARWNVIGALDGYVNDLIVYKNEIYAAGNFTGPAHDPFKNLAKWDGIKWISVAGSKAVKINGEVHTMLVSDEKLIIGGSFTDISGLAVSNIAEFDGNTFKDLAGGVPAEVRTLETYNHNLYAAGDFVNGTDTFGLARFTGSGWENLLASFGYIDHPEGDYISAMAVSEAQLLLGGHFDFNPMLGTYGKNLATYDGQSFSGLATLDSSVNSLTLAGNQVFMGGAFKNSTYGWSGDKVELNSITYFSTSLTSGIDEPNSTRLAMDVYPNPFTDRAIVRIKEDQKYLIREIQIYDLSGRMIQRIKNTTGKQVEISADQLSRGTYVMQAIGKYGTIGTQKLIVQ